MMGVCREFLFGFRSLHRLEPRRITRRCTYIIRVRSHIEKRSSKEVGHPCKKSGRVALLYVRVKCKALSREKLEDSFA